MRTVYPAQILMAGVAEEMRNVALTGSFDGTDDGVEYLAACECVHHHYSGVASRIMFARDDGYVKAGIFRSRDLERCFRLSLSFVSLLSGEPDLFHHELAKKWIECFFGEHKAKTWCEFPRKSRTAKGADYHFRLFCDGTWVPLTPNPIELLQHGWWDWPTYAAAPSQALSHLKLVASR